MTTLVSAIITAGGMSSRFGGANKLLKKIHGKEVIQWTFEAFERSNVGEIIVCANPTIIDALPLAPSRQGIGKKIKIVAGGATRQESVFNGLRACTPGTTHVLVHDAARPLITTELINQAVEMTVARGAMTVAVKTTDTIKEVKDGVVERTVPRENLYNTQTPQGFEYGLLIRAHTERRLPTPTDDASMVEALGEKVYILEGSARNIKLTTRDDLAAAEAYLSLD